MSVSPGTVGDVIGDQVEPFQSSMLAASVVTVSPLPTATHQVDVTQDALVIPLVWFAVVLVLGIVVQFDALTVAGEERAAPATDAPWLRASGRAVRARTQPRAPKRSSERIATPLVGMLAVKQVTEDTGAMRVASS